jgi:glycyl-tRNA synthetase alpha chain
MIKSAIAGTERQGDTLRERERATACGAAWLKTRAGGAGDWTSA